MFLEHGHGQDEKRTREWNVYWASPTHRPIRPPCDLITSARPPCRVAFGDELRPSKLLIL
jgi:hypothetical protein